MYNPNFGGENQSGDSIWTYIEGAVVIGVGIAVCVAGTVTTDGAGTIICTATL
jgi:hypothetical protein